MAISDFVSRRKEVKVPIGMKWSIWAPIATEPESALPTYSQAEELGAARLGTLTVQVSTADIEGDDVVLLHFAKFLNGQLVTETTYSDLAAQGKMFGHTVDADGTAHASADDEPPMGGYVFAEPVIKTDKSIVYRASYFPKVCADPASEAQNAATRQGGQLSPAYPSVTLNVYACNTGDWRIQKEFTGDTAEEDARTWCKTQLGISG